MSERAYPSPCKGVTTVFARSNDELDKMPPLGDMVKCGDCGKMHKVEFGQKVLADGSREPSDFLGFIKCPDTGKLYLVGMGGKQL